MKKILSNITLSNFLPRIALATWGYFLPSTRTYAVDVGVKIPGFSQTSYTYNSYVSAVLKYSIRLGFALAVLMMIYAGIKYLTSQGNQTQVNDAKEIILGAIIGFTMLLLIDLILRFLGIK